MSNADPAVSGRMLNEIYVDSFNLVKAERASLERWSGLGVEDRAAVVLLVRETLLRLLSDPGWIQRSLVNLNYERLDRLEVTFMVDLTERDRVLQTLHAQRDDELKSDLLSLLAELRSG